MLSNGIVIIISTKSFVRNIVLMGWINNSKSNYYELKNVSVNKNYKTIGNCSISTDAEIMDGVIIGKKFRRLLDGYYEDNWSVTEIKTGVYVGYHSIIGKGSSIGNNSIIDDYCIFESNVLVGEKNLFIYRTQICSNVKIGNNCVIGGFIGERTNIGNNCRIFGSIVHSQYEPLSDWDAESSMEDSSDVFDDVFIGFNAIISAPVKIGPKSYVCAGSTITRNVPEKYIAYGINKMVHFSNWKGPLRKSNLFK